ncbi:MAG: hypothetical protein K5870_10990 [Lachnospiraceae bacterium]|nr:hypothetical protein [Lachnospiraceae bacterium]
MTYQGMTDIHCHILYGTDDGAQDLETGLKMLRIAYEEGIRSIILTPHYKPRHHHPDNSVLLMKMQELRDMMISMGIGIDLYLGNEVLYFNEVPERLRAGFINSMANSRYVLVEFMPNDDYSYIKSSLYGLLSEGYLPILAHIERYECMLREPDRAREIKEMGIYIQVNSGSVDGSLGRVFKKYTRHLIENDLIDFVASDAHDTHKRAPRFGRCIKYMNSRMGKEYVHRIMSDNPLKIISDEFV